MSETTKKTASKDITKVIKTFQDALDYNGETLEQFNKRTEHDAPNEKAYKKLKSIVLALNEGKPMDYTDTSVWKYYPWFYSVGSGVGFSCLSYDYDLSDSSVGARLCLRTSKLAIYAGQQFIQEYNEYING